MDQNRGQDGFLSRIMAAFRGTENEITEGGTSSATSAVSNLEMIDLMMLFCEQLDMVVEIAQNISNLQNAKGCTGELQQRLLHNVDELIQEKNYIQAVTANINTLNEQIIAVQRNNKECKKELDLLKNEENRLKELYEKENETREVPRSRRTSIETRFGPVRPRLSTDYGNQCSFDVVDESVETESKIPVKNFRLNRRNKSISNAEKRQSNDESENGITLFLHPIVDGEEFESSVDCSNPS